MFAIPEHTVLPPVTHHPLSPTALVRSLAADPLRWRTLVAGAVPAPAASATAGRLTGEPAPVTVPLPSEDPRVRGWLCVWPPRWRGPARRYEAPQGAFAVLSGQVVEQSAGRVRALRPGQVRIFGPGYRHSVLNGATEPAVTVHVQIRLDPAAALAVDDAWGFATDPDVDRACGPAVLDQAG